MAKKYPLAVYGTTIDELHSGDTLAGMLGEIKIYAGPIAPDGWALCNGYAISRTVYAELFAVIGTIYGVGDGSTTFNLPNLANRFPVGDNGSMLGSAGGNAAVTLTTTNLPSHTHAATFTGTGGGSAVQVQASTNPLGSTGTPGNGYYIAAQKAVGGQPLFVPDTPAPTTTVTLGGVSGGGITGGTVVNDSTGSGASVDIIPPFLTLNFIIAVV